MKYCVAANMAGSPTTPVPLSGDFCEQMRKAHEMGYDAIEIHVPDGFICAMQMSKGSRNCLSGCARLSTVRRS